MIINRRRTPRSASRTQSTRLTPAASSRWSTMARTEPLPSRRPCSTRWADLEADEFLDRCQELLRLLKRRTVTATLQLDVFGTWNLVDDLLVERRWRRLVEFATHDKRRHLHMVQHRHEIGFLQDLACRLKCLWIDAHQDFLAFLYLLGVRSEIGRRENSFCGDLCDAAQAAVSYLFSHDRESFASLRRESGRGITHDQLRYSLRMRERKCQSDSTPKPIAYQHRVLAYSELIETVFDYREIGIHQRQHRWLRSVKARQVEQCDAMLGRQLRQHWVKGKTIGKQRVQQDQIPALAHPNGGERAASGA